MNILHIYYKLPVFLQNMACYVEGSRIRRTRYGRDFWRFLEEYESRNDWSYEHLCGYRDTKLQQMIKHCYDTVPYYTRLFHELGIDYRSIKTIDDMKILPITTKQVVKENLYDFISTSVPKSKLKIHFTGGTTGSGLAFYTTDEEEAEQWAVWWRYRRNLGIEFDTWCGIFGGKTIVPINNNVAPYWRYNTPCKQVFFSGYHINDKTFEFYVDEIAKRKLQWLHGYPSNIANLANYMIDHKIKLDIKYITIGSENLYDYQRDMIIKAFNTVPYQHYGLTEGVANISQKLDGKLYIDEDFCAVECIPNSDSSYALIGTTLSNWAMPLLRYDTGDQVSVNLQEPMTNNKGGRIIRNINGRSNEYVALNDGTRVSSAALSLVFKDIVTIRDTQIIQQQKDAILVRIVKMQSYSQKDEERTTAALKERLGESMRIVYEYVEKIPRTAGGKLRLVISEIE